MGFRILWMTVKENMEETKTLLDIKGTNGDRAYDNYRSFQECAHN